MEPVKATPEQRDEFELFLFEMDVVLEDFLNQAVQHGVALDYTIDSLDQLETLAIRLLDQGEDADLVCNRCARYLGEVFRKTLGGKWELCLKDRKYLYFGLPVLAGYSSSSIEFCPLAVVRNFNHSRKEGTLRTALESHWEFRASPSCGD